MPGLNPNNQPRRGMPKAYGPNSVLRAVIVMLTVLIAVTVVLGYMVYSDINGSKGILAGDGSAGSDPFGPGAVPGDAARDEEMQKAIAGDKIYDNIFVNGVNIGGMTDSQALAALNEKLKTPLEEKTITLSHQGQLFDFTFGDFKAGFELDKAVSEALMYARQGSVLERFGKVTALKNNPYEITAGYFYDESAVKNIVSGLAPSVDIPAKEASYARSEGEFVITKGANGIKLDIAKTDELVADMLKTGEGGVIEVVTETSAPVYQEEDFLKARDIIGTFTTNTSASDTPRNTNIKNALSKINNVTLYPGDVFSTNERFGEMTYDNGYRLANAIKGNKFEEDWGGGVCQVSSTLYVSLLHAELEIVERANHSLKVSYADYGYDATLAGTYIDLKFKNNTDYPVLVEGYMKGGNVTVNIYGFEIHSPDRTVKLSNKFISSTEPSEPVIVEDAEMPLGQQTEIEPARTGFKYELYKTVYEKNVEIEKVKVNTSTYKATAAEIHIGTNPDLPAETAELPELPQKPAPEDTIAPPYSAEPAEPPVQPNPDESSDLDEWPDGIPRIEDTAAGLDVDM